jgi:hypothetical protein
VSYVIFAEMVRTAWQRATEPVKNDEEQADGEE